MPIYEYECRGCGSRFEKIVYGKPEPRCPSCDGGDLNRLLSTFAVSSSSGTSKARTPGACGTCGDPRGPGSCSIN